MPVVHIHMYKGRTKEQKKELVRRITEDFEKVVNVKPESLHCSRHFLSVFVAIKTESGSNGSGLERKGPRIPEKPAWRSHVRISSSV